MTIAATDEQQQSTSRSRRRRILVVGAGISGCVAAWCVRRRMGGDSSSSSPLAVDIEVWDGARGCGGRLATQRVSTQGGEEIRMNMGAPRLHYYSDVDDDCCDVQNELIECLKKDGIVEVLQPQTSSSSAADTSEHNGGGGILLPRGASNEICRWMLTKAQVQTKFQSRIRSIDFDTAKRQFVVSIFGRGRGGSNQKSNIKRRCGRNASNDNNMDSNAEFFDAVLFAGSPAEVRTTYGDMQQLTKPMWRQVRRIQHTRSCCLGLAFRDETVARGILEVFHNNNDTVLPANDRQGTIEEMILQPSAMAHHIVGRASGEQSRNKKHRICNDMAVLVAVSTEKFAETHCQHVRATRRPTAEDRQHQRILSERLQKRVCQILEVKLAAASSSSLSPTCTNIPANQISKAVVARKINYWKYAQVLMMEQQQHQFRSSCNKVASNCCFIADCAAPFVVVGDYFPGSHRPQRRSDGNSSGSNDKACGFTAVVQSGEAAAKEVARVLLQ